MLHAPRTLAIEKKVVFFPTPKRFKLLLIDDNLDDARIIKGMLNEAVEILEQTITFDITVASHLEQGLRRLEQERFDIVLSDLTLSDAQGLEAIQRLLSHASELPVVLMSDVNDEVLVFEAAQHGAQDYLMKGRFNGTSLMQVLFYAIERKQSEQRQKALAEVELAFLQPHDLQTLLDQIVQSAASLLPASGGASIVVWDEITQSFVLSATTVPGQPRTSTYKQVRRTGGATRWIIDHGQPLIVPDIREAPIDANKMLSEHGLQAYIGVPMIAGGKTVGVLYGLDRFAREYKLTDVSFLSTLANRAAAAIVKSQELAEEREQRRLAEILRSVTTAMNASLALDDVLHMVLEGLSAIVSYDSAAVLLLDGEHLYVKASRGFQDQDELEFFQLPLNQQDLFAEIARTRRAIVLDDAQLDPRFKRLATVSDKIRSWIGVPLIWQGVVTGLLTIDGFKPGMYSQREADLALTFAHQAAIAIENARLYEETQSALEKAEALYQAAHSLITVDNLQEVLRTIANGAIRALDASAVTLIVTDLSEQTVEYLEAVTADDMAVTQKLSFAELWEGLTGWVLRNKKPALSLKGFPDPRESPSVQRRRRETGAGSIIVAPLLFRDKLLGTMTAINHVDKPDFELDDVEIMLALANKASIAIQNARLFEEMHHLATTDGLTGLYTRRYFFERGEEIIQQASETGQAVSAIMVDVDYFKQFNDRYGHAVGDRVLQVVADSCRQEVRESDLVGRYGGEEFVILLPNTSLSKAKTVAERLRERLAFSPLFVEDHTLTLTISAGVAELSSDTSTLWTLVNAADQALYRAKGNGRNRVCVWDPSMESALVHA
jgi:diguanylate cyclase (GGDEF)-like protein